jgi:6-phosphogluconolactonase
MTANRKDRIIVAANIERLASESADLFRRIAIESVTRSGRFSVALSGGSNPRPFHRLLADEPYRSGIPWAQTHIFWVDERLVPADDPASNFGTARNDFLARLPIQRSHVHPMCSDKPPPRAADDYQRTLGTHFGVDTAGAPVFDLVVLGIGIDGHTASIFPGDRTAVETDRWVVAVTGGSPNVARLTLTLPVLERARYVIFLVSGRQKAATVHTIITGDTSLPPRQIAPAGGMVTWLLDRDAAYLLPAGLDGVGPAIV